MRIPARRAPIAVFLLTAALVLGGRPAMAARWNQPGLGMPVTRSFDARDTGAFTRYRCTLRTHDGRLFLGHDGVLEFDGETWRPTPVPTNGAVRALSEDERGRIWVGGENVLGYLSAPSAGPAVFTSVLPLLPAEHRREIGSVSAVFALPSGGTLAVTDTRVFHLQPEGVKVWLLPAPRRLSAWRDSAGSIYIVQPGTGTLRFSAGNLERADFPEPFGSAGVEWAVHLAGDIRLFGTAERALRQEGASVQPLGEATAEILHDDRVVAAVPLGDEFAALATTHHGVIILDAQGRRVATIDQSSGLPDARVVHLAASADSGVTVTTPEAVTWFCDEPQATFFDHRHGLAPGAVSAIARTGSVLVLANDKLVLRFVPGTLPGASGHWDALSELPAPVIALHPLGAGVLASSTTSLAQLATTPDTITYLRHGDIPSCAPWSGRPDGLAWVERSSFRVGEVAHGTLRETAPPLTIDPEVSNIVEGADRTHWIATNHAGIFRIAPSGLDDRDRPVVRTYRNLPPHGDTAPPRVFRIGHRIAVTTTEGFALHTTVGDRFVPYPGLSNARIHAISEPEPDGTVWLALSQRDRFPFQVRIARLRTAGDGVTCELVRLPPLPLEHTPTSLFAEAGPDEPARVFWMGFAGKLLRIESPGTPAAPPPPPTITATELLADGHSLAPVRRDRPYVGFENSGLRFDVRVPRGRLGQRVHLEARLLGVDPDWVPLAEIPSRVFRGLRDRSYRFEARTVDALGTVSPATTMEFTVRPPWWRSASAYTAYTLSLLLAAALVFVVHTRLDRRRRRELEALVAQRTHELATANAAKSEFLAHINHEIRNPLNGVIGLSAMLAQQHQDDHSRQLARSLKACANYLGSVVDNVLDLARIEAGRIEISPQRFEPRLLIADIAEMFRLQVEEGGGRISWSAAPDLPQFLVGDAHRIRQVLVNFTANAARYARGGDVRLSVRQRSQVDQLVTVVFTVSDTGPGIAPAEQSRIFEKFARGQSAGEDAETRGHGVGLALVRSLAHLLGGEADVDSQLGFGAKFRLTVPLQLAPAAPAPVAAIPGSNLPALRVLVIDDQGFNRLVLRDQLERLGCRVEESADGHSAHLLLQTRAHHVAFIDLDLPGIDGLDLIKRVRGEGPRNPAFLVATTASATRGIEELVLAAGADAFLPKPISLPLLVTLLETCAARRQLAEPSPEPRPPQPTPPATATRPSGLFVDLPLTTDTLRQLLAEFEVEISALSASWRRMEAPTARRHAHRLASLGILSHDEPLIAAARRAEEALRSNRAETSRLVDELLTSARSRSRLLAEEIGDPHGHGRN